MFKMNFLTKDLMKSGLKSTIDFAKKNAPHIMTGTAVVGVGVTSYFAVKGVIRAKDIINAEKERRVNKLLKDCKESNLYPENNNTPPTELIELRRKIPKKEMIKMIWKPIFPMLLSGATTIGCIIGSDVVNSGRNAALMAVATASSKALEEYQKKNIELFGEKAHQKVIDEEAKEVAQNGGSSTDTDIIDTGKGTMLIIDGWTGNRMYSSRDAIDKAVNALNYEIFNNHSLFYDGFISLGDFYDEIGITQNHLKPQIAERIGWNKRHIITLDYTSVLLNDDTPVLVFKFKNEPLEKWQLDDRYIDR